MTKPFHCNRDCRRSQSVVIDGTTQPGIGDTPGIVLNGSGAGASVNGLALDASHSMVKGLVIDSFEAHGIVISAASSDTITDDYIGVTAAGNVAAGNGESGVLLRTSPAPTRSAVRPPVPERALGK